MKQAILVGLERYFLALAKMVIAAYRPVIIGVTGSVGKTTTKEAIFHVLKENKLPVLRTEGNLNADLGIALTVLGYDHSPAIWEWPFAFVVLHLNWLLKMLHMVRLPKYFVVEMGIDRIGDMARMVQSIQPTIGVVTWIGEGHHLEYLKDTATIAHEKGQMLTVLPKDGLAVIPAKDPNTKILHELATAPVAAFESTGLDSLADIVTAVGAHVGLTQAQVKKAFATFKQPKGRLNEFDGVNSIRVLDDSYNMSLPAAREALSILAKRPGKRKVAILGDILEQGEYEERFHQEVAKLAKQQADLFIGVGKRMQKVKPDHWFASPDEAAEKVPALLQEGDVVLVKGSQGMRMEKISFALATDKDEAKKVLPRQTLRWQQIPFKNP